MVIKIHIKNSKKEFLEENAQFSRLIFERKIYLTVNELNFKSKRLEEKTKE